MEPCCLFPTLDTLAAFAMTSLAIELTPGPNMAYLAVLSAEKGRRAGFAGVAGVGLGLLGLGVAAAIGLAAVVSSSRLAYEALRWAGVCYLLYLAYDTYNGGGEEAPKGMGDDEAASFARGLVTNLLNPKAFLFYVTVQPEFIRPEAGTLVQTAVLTLLYVTIATAIHAAIVGLAGAARPFLEDGKRLQWTQRAFGVVIGAIALWLAWSTAR